MGWMLYIVLRFLLNRINIYFDVYFNTACVLNKRQKIDVNHCLTKNLSF